ncbi:TetR/AcrR family transcriptional regulator [Clostridium intestinale]|uniref:TetR family transcriptional regulator n=2 Tax=Clostridium intestinale TaxID=36845 RepID=U2N5A3_9CLOT|nr:TetR/AcrR family transcriptional regulator [Clostridium intestinale]ERK30692.1 TetR family transcriptional regulator [Clostridium intestinale URNW]QLY77864.1 TetR/AcrR family transcriptional regulator [Clostridium intestinale]
MIINESDPRVKRTRELITNAFISVISKKGFDSITVKDITSAATINRATFYAHFTDKYDLLDTLVVEKFKEILSQKVQGEPSLNEDTIRSLVLCICDYFETIKGTCKCGYLSILPLIGDKIIEELYSTIYNILKKEPKLASKKPEEIELMTTMISTCIYKAVYKREFQKMPIAKEILVEDVLDFVFNGLNMYRG